MAAAGVRRRAGARRQTGDLEASSGMCYPPGHTRTPCQRVALRPFGVRTHLAPVPDPSVCGSHQHSSSWLRWPASGSGGPPQATRPCPFLLRPEPADGQARAGQPGGSQPAAELRRLRRRVALTAEATATTATAATVAVATTATAATAATDATATVAAGPRQLDAQCWVHPLLCRPQCRRPLFLFRQHPWLPLLPDLPDGRPHHPVPWPDPGGRHLPGRHRWAGAHLLGCHKQRGPGLVRLPEL